MTDQKGFGKTIRRELQGFQYSERQTEKEIRTGLHETPYPLHGSFETISLTVGVRQQERTRDTIKSHLSTSSICISSSFSDISSPLSSRCKRDLRSADGNTTVGFKEYIDIGGLRMN